MKRLLTCVLLILILISTASFSVFAASEPTLSVDKVTVAPGGVVAVPVKLSNNPGLWGMVINVEFDTSVFSVEEIKNNSDIFANGEIMIGPADFKSGYVRIVATPSDITKNNVKNGRIVTIYFKALKNAADGVYPINLKYSERDICDINAKNIKVTPLNGEIKIIKDYQTSTTKKDNGGDVLATEGNTKNTQRKTKIKTVYVTDKAGEYVTDSSGKKQTETVISDVTESQSTTLANIDNKTETENSTKAINNKPSETMSIWYIILIISVIVIIAGVITAIVLIKKNKVKK